MGLRKLAAITLLSGASVAAGIIGANVINGNVKFARLEQTVLTARQELARMPDTSNIFREVAQAVEPSVVNISVRKTVKVTPSEMPDDMLRRFFHDFRGQNMPDMPDMPGDSGQGTPRHFEQRGTGSGVIIEVKDGVGYILTNNHVAGGADRVDVTLSDGRQFTNAKVLGADPDTDLAVVEIKADHLIPAQWGDSNKLEQGDRVMAFGSPFGYVGSMTHGIVSALHRQAGILGQYGYEDFIQVDAPINPGNSGGPLVDAQGRVVGINTAIASESGGFQGIGFAIPSAEAHRIYTILKEKGHVTRSWLGVQIEDVAKAPEDAKAMGYTGSSGVLVRGVLRKAPAAGNLQPGDVITSMNGKTIDNAEQLRDAVAKLEPGSEAKLQVVRNGKTEQVTIKTGKQPGANGTAGNREHAEPAGKLGMALGDLTQDMAQRYGLPNTSGALVRMVRPDSPAAQAGIHSGDVITQVNGKKVTNATEAADALSKADLNAGIRLNIANREGSEFVFIQPKK